jgi:hypothetical protein
MSRPASTHPLDADLLDYVEGVCDAATADSIASHLAACLLCRIKQRRLVGVPPMEFADVRDLIAPEFGAIDVAPAGGEAPRRGELWLTTSDEPTMVLVRSVRADDAGVVVVPVTLDVEVADRGVVVLDEARSPLVVPIAIYEDLTVSLPTESLAGRVVPRRVDIDLWALSGDEEGVSHGSPIEGLADPRLEIRQYLVDRLTALDPYEPPLDDDPDKPKDSPLVGQLRDELLFRRGPNCDVQPLSTLPAGTQAPPTWVGLALVLDFTVRVVVIETPLGLRDESDFSAAQALVVRLDASALAVCTSSSDAADIYEAPALFRAFLLPEGIRSSEPLISGVALPDAVAKYLDQKRVVISAITSSSQRAPRVDAASVLARAVVDAVDATASRASRLGPEKSDGYLRLPAWQEALGDVLRRALEPSFDPQWVVDAIEDEPR